MSIAQALRALIARYEHDGIPNDSLPTVEAARAALAEGDVRGSIFGEVVVTRNAAGAIVLVSWQGDDGRILSVIAEAGRWGVRKLGVGMSAGECIIFDTKAEADQQAADYGGDVVRLTYENGRWTAQEPTRCSNCGKPDARITDGDSEGEVYCSPECQDQHDELGCPHETHHGFRHPTESARLIAAENALQRIRAGIATDRCDGESEWANGVNAACANHLKFVDTVLGEEMQEDPDVR
jgi:hypothetical protein